jgi:hypothetical protein
MKTELKQIIQELKEVIKDENLNITHSELMDFSIRLYNGQKANDSKTKPYYQSKEFADSQPASQNQINLIKKLNNNVVPENINIKEARILLDKLTNLSNEKPISDQLATDKQIYALKKLKVSFPADITKLEASKLINQYKN